MDNKGALAILKELLKSGNLESLMAELETENSSVCGTQYECTNCGHALQSEKPKKRCPECRKHKLVLVDEAEEAEEVEEYRVGERQKETTCRRQSINVQRGRQRQFISDSPDPDDDDFREDTESFTKKVKFKVSSRPKTKFKKTKATCSECSGVHEIVPELHREGWVCDSCIRKKVRNR